MKKVLVTGAAGFIGSHVVRELLAENKEVRCLIRPGESTRNLEGLDVEKVQGDILKASAVEKALDGVDTVFHLAAIFSIWMKDWSRIYEVNIQGSRNVLWSCLKKDVEKVVFTSSIAAVGIAPGEALSNEDTPFNQYTLGSHYVLTKYLSQQEALGFAKNGLQVVVVNPCFPFGPMDTAPTPTGQIVVDILKGVNRAFFEGGINIIDVRDVARGHVLAAKKGRAGRLYILGNRNIAMEEFLRLVGRVAGFDGRMLLKMPVSIMKAGTAGLKWLSDNVTRKPPLSTPSEIAYASQYLYFDNARAVRELGLTFSPVEDSLKDSIEWFRENGYA
ncbi:MAG: SDR family oxidoreductase [Desulfobacterota bacterium]|jgi:dihydroflavonol-4-reductase|nr:SDR family oxidoreductase [Thermodesulfobacteriota bacterium]